MKRLSLQWRITLMSVLLIGITCVAMNLLLCSSGVYYMDTIADSLQGGGTVILNDGGAASFDPQLIAPNEELTIVVDGVQGRFRTTNWYITAAVTLLSGILAYFVSGRALKPLRSFASQVEQVQLSNLKPSILQTENSIRLAKLMLKMYLSIPENVEIEVVGELDAMRDAVLAGTDGLTTDVQDNSDLRTLELQEDLLKRQLKVANAGRMPTVTAFFTATYTGNDIDMTKLNFGGAEGGQPGDVLDGSKFWWQHPMSAGLQVSIPIFSGLTKMNRSREIKNQISQIGLQRDYARQQIDVEVRAALNDLLTARETMYAQELTVAQARKAYSISDTRYRAGAGTILELNSAQLAQTQAELNFSQAIFDYLTAKAEYDRIVGKEN